MMRERGRVMEGQGEIVSHNHKYLSCFHVLEVLISKHCKQLLIEETHILHFELCKIMSSTQFYISCDPVRGSWPLTRLASSQEQWLGCLVLKVSTNVTIPVSCTVNH